MWSVRALHSLATNTSYGGCCFLKCFRYGPITSLSVLRDASQLRAAARGLDQAFDAMIARITKLEVCWMNDDDSDSDDGDDQEDLECRDILLLPWRHLRLQALTIYRHAGEALDDAFVEELMRELDKTRSEGITLNFGMGGNLKCPVFNSRKVHAVRFGGHRMGFETSIERLVVTPNLQNITVFDAPELRHIGSAAHNTLTVLSLHAPIDESSQVVETDLAELLRSHAASLREVSLHLSSESAGLSVLDALACLQSCETLVLRFECEIPMEKLLPVLSRTRHVSLISVGRMDAEVRAHFGVNKGDVLRIKPSETAHSAFEQYASFRVESLVLHNLGWIRGAWSQCLRSCTNLRYYAASTPLCHYPVLLDSLNEIQVEEQDVRNLPPSLTHIYETRCGVVATSGPWGLRGKKEAHRQARMEQIELASNFMMPQEVCGIRSSVRPDPPPRELPGKGADQRLLLSALEAALEAELGVPFWAAEKAEDELF